MDILDLIKKEHRQVTVLFSEIESTKHIQRLYACFNKLSGEIKLHTYTKQQIFYPAIQNCLTSNQVIDKAQTEHREVNHLLDTIESLSPASVEFQQKIKALKTAITQHFQTEENEIFPQLFKTMNYQEREQLGHKFADAKVRLENEI